MTPPARGKRPGRAGAVAGAVHFGTSGWRGVLGEDFTFTGARAVARAVAEWVLQASGPRRVVVAHDTRFLGETVAGEVAAVLAGAGIAVVRSPGAVPTPVASTAVRRRRAAAGVIVTASHNPPAYQGIKVVAPWGGAAPETITRELERRAARWLAATPPMAPPRGRPVDLEGAYRRGVLARLAPLRRPVHVVYDAMHGVGAGVMDALLVELGAEVRVLNADPDARFGGMPPDPTADRLGALARATRRGRGARLGLATDGDADRLAAVDGDGRVLAESDAVALLVDHLARTGRARRGVALSVATGTLPERVARAHGLAVKRHPIGFKHLTRALVEGAADVAGEESGGFAWAPLAHDKDGILAGCLLVELVSESGSLRSRLGALRRAHGGGLCGRVAVAAPPGGRAALESLRRHLPARIDGAKVLGTTRRDGLRASLSDGFLMWRASGTEPLWRVYAEAPGSAALDRRLRVGARMLRRAAEGWLGSEGRGG